ncbi:hypothetical protein BBP40_000762 [Aspergillus hancockii]|nr:hypothetical protein BBP40_000762 [Aspergillus hancockii]
MACFQILSDLHLEAPEAYNVFDIPPQTTYLALLGDIGNVKDDGLFTFLEAQLHKFQIVFFLLGNHEPYHSNWVTAREKFQHFSNTINQKRTQESQQLGQFVLLDQTRYDISPDVTVLGCTLYSRVSKDQEMQVSFGLNDFYHTDDWTVEAHCAAHEADRAWLNDQVSQIAVSEPHRKIVIFSHHSPTLTPAAVDPAHTNSPLSSGFASDFAGEPCWENTQVCLWAFGHTHYNCDFAEDTTGKRLVANQRGYYFAQAKVFDPKKVVRV